MNYESWLFDECICCKIMFNPQTRLMILISQQLHFFCFALCTNHYQFFLQSVNNRIYLCPQIQMLLQQTQKAPLTTQLLDTMTSLALLQVFSDWYAEVQEGRLPCVIASLRLGSGVRVGGVGGWGEERGDRQTLILLVCHTLKPKLRYDGDYWDDRWANNASRLCTLDSTIIQSVVSFLHLHLILT